MFKLNFLIVAATFILGSSAFAAQSLSSQLALAAKQTDNNIANCDKQLKALPDASDSFPLDLIKGVKASPAYPKETADMMEILSNTSVPTDKADLQASVEQLDKAPTCWNANSLALQFKGAKLIIDQGTKRQKEDFAAAIIARLRSENKKQLVLLPLTVYLDTLEQLSNAELLNSSVTEEIHQAHQRAQELASKLSQMYPDADKTKDNKTILEIRKAELSSSRQVQALIDSILKKI